MPPQNNPTPAIDEQISSDGIPIESSAATESTEKPIVESAEPKQQESTETTKSDEVDLTSFLNVKGEVPPPEDKTVKATPTETVNKETNKTVVPKTTPQQQQPVERDLTDLDADIAPAFKKMSNEAFNTLKPVFKNLKTTLAERDAKIAELEKGVVRLPESYYEHPQAIVLTPEFNDLSQDVNQATLVLQHWEKQLVAITEGAKDYDFLYKDEQGKWAMRKMPADSSAQVKVQSYFNFAQNQQMQYEHQLKTLVANHTTKVKEHSTWARNFEKTSFPKFEEEDGKKQYGPIIEDTIRQLPAVYQRSPLALILAKSLVVNQQLSAFIRTNLPNLQQQANPNIAKVAADKAKAGPTAAETGASTVGNGATEVTVDDFNKVKAGY